MRSPFPGMDPWLEDPEGWHPFHTQLVAKLGDAINSALPGGYYASVEERTYIVTGEDREEVQIPDALVVGGNLARSFTPGKSAVLDLGGVQVLVPAPEILRQRFLEIRRQGEGRRVVTAVEVLSPSNKRPGMGRDDYAAKRGRVLSSLTNLVEVDLLRTGPRMGVLGAPEGSHYSVLISRAHLRPVGQFLPIGLWEPLPDFPVPLLPDEDEPVISLSAVLDRVYEAGRYDSQIDYKRPPIPPLDPEADAWADAVLRERGLR
jgi:hypothetical protein